MPKRWQFWIDRGGTFTDCLGLEPTTNRVHTAKVLSSDGAPLEAIRQILAIDHETPIPPSDIRMGTTVATNALLERKGTPCALATTTGFRDLLEIGTQARPRIFDLEILKPELLYAQVVELDARLDAGGTILSRPDDGEIERGLAPILESGITSLAVVIIHAYRNGELEDQVAQVARRIGFTHVSCSHDVANEIGMVGRGDTTTVDAYLTPLLRQYLDHLRGDLPGSTLRIMQSSGGLTDSSRFSGQNAILSGPAGGVVASAAVATRAGFDQSVGFDMGGTSTDVSRFGGTLEREYETEVSGVRLRAPMLAIHTVAAGGGSICRYDGYRLTVGPDSAGATPGPLCYGNVRATDLAITDVNLFLGRVLEDRFPFSLAPDRVRRALEDIAARMHERGEHRSLESIAEGFFDVANAAMAQAIRKVSIAKGYDVRDHALVVFGGAGGQHACAIARRLQMKTIVIHPYAGILSAFGMGLADVRWHDVEDAGRAEYRGQDFGDRFATIEARGRAALEADGFETEMFGVERRIDLRYRGTETSISVDAGNGANERFESAHRTRFGYARSGHTIEVVALRVDVVAPGASYRPSPPAVERHEDGHTHIFIDGSWHEDVVVLQRESLAPGREFSGPALVLEATGTTVVEPGFSARVDDVGCLILRDESAPARQPLGAAVDPVQLEIFNNVFMSIAEQMGVVLRRTALSTNIRERLDFSSAVFDADGGLVANAPHIPVHLGAMSESIRGVLDRHPSPRPGDVFVTNDPAGGGSHLPDITVITPVFGDDGDLSFFTASRGHHEDVGGITPGSMPPFSTKLADEGVVFRAEHLVRGGQLQTDRILDILGSGDHPARSPHNNIADLEAQVAANNTGANLLFELVERYGATGVAAYMRHVQTNARERVEDAIVLLGDGRRKFVDRLDDGSRIAVTIEVAGRRMVVDFAGTDGELDNNLNAPPAVTIAATLYVLRTLVGEPIPLNGGCLEPVQIDIPPKSLLSPGPSRAVCGGNVETSQRVVDVLLGALGRAAASQGTMNNLTFGADDFGYYETIAGGAGATPYADGASGVHTHMTNTRITDPEVLESRFAVRLSRFSLRRGSGGAGLHRGGDGVVREIEFLAPMRVSILSQRRRYAPFGLDGGASGQAGKNFHNGAEVGERTTFDVRVGDRVRIETPGGGGYGITDDRAD